MKIIINILLSTIFCLNILEANTNVTLQLSWKNQFQFAGYYMAKEKGFYSDANLDVNIKEFDSGTDASDDVVKGKADFAVGRSSLICDRYDGKPIVLLAAVFQHSPVMLLVKKRDDIAKIEDLKNKKIMLSGDLTASAPINAMLQSKKVTQKMFTIQTHSFDVQDLINDKTDAMLSYISNEPYTLKKQNIPYTIFSPRDYNFDFYSDILFTSTALIKKNPQIVKAFREASLKGWKYAIEHKEETVALILNKYNTQGRTKDALLFEANEIEKLVNKNAIELGNIDPKRIEYIAQIYSLMGFINTKEKMTDFIYKVEKPIKENGIYLSAEEKSWLVKHPILRVSSESDYAPWDFNVKGEAKGYSIDYVNLLASKINIKVEYINDTWDNLVSKLQDKEIDIVHTMFKNNIRKDIIYTTPYKKVINALYTNQKNQKIKSIADLNNALVSITKGDSSVIAIQRKYPNIRFTFTDNYANSLKEVAFNRADAAVLEPGVANYLIKEFNIPDIKIVDEFASKDLGVEYAFHFGVHKDNQLLVSILNKAIQSLKTSEIDTLYNKWFENGRKAQTLKFTEVEKEFIKTHPTIILGADQNWKPFDWKDKLGNHAGFDADFTRLLEEKLNINIEVKLGEWTDIQNDVKDKKISGIMGASKDENRDKYMVFTKPYFMFAQVVLIEKDNKNISSISDLKAKTIALKKGSSDIPYFNEKYPSIKQKLYNTDAEIIKALSAKEVDAALSNIGTASYEIERNFISNVKIAFNIDELAGDMRYGIRNDQPELVSILQKGIDVITEAEMNIILGKWVKLAVTNDDLSKLNLTQNEIAWLDKKIPIKYVYDPDGAPLEWKNELSEHTGIVYDLLNLIKEKSGIKFQQVPVQNWREAISLMQEGKADMYSAIGENEERKAYVNFTKNTIFKTPYVFVSRVDDPQDYLETFQAIADKKVAVVDGYTIHGILKDKKPNISILTVKNLNEGFEKIRDKTLDVFIVNAATAKYFINTKGYEDLKIATKIEFNLELKIALQKDLSSEVLSILDKAVDSISDKESSDIYRKWTEQTVEEIIDYTLIWKILIVVFVIILVFLFYNRKLKKLVNEKTIELQELVKSLDKKVEDRTKDLKESQEQFASMVSNIPGAIYRVRDDSAWPIIYISDEIKKITGYPVSDFVERKIVTFSTIMYPEDVEPIGKEIQEQFKNGKSFQVDYRVINKDGNIVWVRSQGQSIKAENGEGYIDGVLIDITEQINTQEAIKAEKEFTQTLLDSQEQIIITTDGSSILSGNKAFLEFYAINSIEEFPVKYGGKCICDTFDTNAPEGYLQKFMAQYTWIDYIINSASLDSVHKVKINRDNVNHVMTVTAANLPGGKGIKSAIFTDITTMERVKQETEIILSNILIPVMIFSRKNRKILYANKAAEIQYETPLDELIGADTDSIYGVKGLDTTIIDTIMKYGKVESLEKLFVTAKGKEFTAIISVHPIEYRGEGALIGMATDITKQKDMENEIRAIHKHTRESIEYAALIQGALIPDDKIFEHFFQDFFAIWNPKDVVGGDIYLMNEFNEDELILMVIDCTGHGVPGAFVTMLVKAIERQLMANIHRDETISPAKILGIFNRSIKNLLKQERIDSVSNAGFDGGIIYYNKKEKILKFSGAETALFYIDENNNLQSIKGSRHSVGYKKSDTNFEFEEHIIDVKEGMRFYCTTDGYLDQNGGEKSFPFGKKRFIKNISGIYKKSFTDQQIFLLNALKEYQGDEDRNDDVTVIGFQI